MLRCRKTTERKDSWKERHSIIQAACLMGPVGYNSRPGRLSAPQRGSLSSVCVRMYIVQLTNNLRLRCTCLHRCIQSIRVFVCKGICAYEQTWCVWRWCLWVRVIYTEYTGPYHQVRVSPAQSPSLSRPCPTQPQGQTERGNTDAPSGLIDVLDKPLIPRLPQPPLQTCTPTI